VLSVVRDDICEQAHCLRRPPYALLLFNSYSGGVETVNSACDLTTDWIYMSVLHEWRFCFTTVGDCWMIMKTRPEAASMIHTCSLLHVKLSCHVLARQISIHLFLRTGRREMAKFANILSTKLCQSAGNVVESRHSFYILALDSSFCSFTIAI
jgi:hypothetical protein